MSRVCLSVLFIFSIAIQFGENNATQSECDGNIEAGSNKTRISFIEANLKELNVSLKNWNKIIESSNDDSQSKDVKGSVSKILNMFEERVHFTAPGTWWCGGGDFARDENDRDFFKESDACCREHHNCQTKLLAGETEVNIINNGIFTRSACACDIPFHMCLRSAREQHSSTIAQTIAIMYFNILKLQCFHCICPTEDCNLEEDRTECKGHCKRYQWINSPEFFF
ncbi:phospholipase A2-like [Monomorium pharaonis]|uniref:phospholipase A2-like n=1 Tax=Monomorium pharaonis TaxID=307658 RepID=UPI001747817D|nr:phospholipase A2-like [Monomorium pharaonis]